jgi:hypothetical protein
MKELANCEGKDFKAEYFKMHKQKLEKLHSAEVIEESSRGLMDAVEEEQLEGGMAEELFLDDNYYSMNDLEMSKLARFTRHFV